jgi:hypothetical protein
VLLIVIVAYIIYIDLVREKIKDELNNQNLRTFGHEGDKNNRFRWACTSKLGDYWKATLTDWKKFQSNEDSLAEKVKQSRCYDEGSSALIVPFILCHAVTDKFQFTIDQLITFIKDDDNNGGDNAYSMFFKTVHTFYQEKLHVNNYYILA